MHAHTHTLGSSSVTVLSVKTSVKKIGDSSPMVEDELLCTQCHELWCLQLMKGQSQILCTRNETGGGGGGVTTSR